MNNPIEHSDWDEFIEAADAENCGEIYLVDGHEFRPAWSVPGSPVHVFTGPESDIPAGIYDDLLFDNVSHP